MRLAILTSHPIQYYAPLFRHLNRELDLHVYFAHVASGEQQAAAGFGTPFTWDVDLQSGYSHTVLKNVARVPDTSHFSGCDTPEIGQQLKAGKFDAVLSLGWHLKSLLQGILASKSMGLPVMIRGDSQLDTPRSFPRRLAKKLAYPVLLRFFDAALYVGERNRAYYLHYGFPQSRLFRSPHCIDTERFTAASQQLARDRLRAQLGISADTRLVLFAGKMITFKRPLDVVEAVSQLRMKGVDAHLLIAGSGELAAAASELAAKRSVPLHALGFQNQSQMPAAYAAADALVLPSNGRETWGLVCNEALASGTPIIVSDAAGCAPDLAADGNVGRTFPLGDPAACAEGLAQVLAAPPSRAEIAAVSARYSLAAASDGILEAVSAVARPSKQRASSLSGTL
jgi:glycosyltransferase involved in cell wall biosynthesis